MIGSDLFLIKSILAARIACVEGIKGERDGEWEKGGGAGLGRRREKARPRNLTAQSAQYGRSLRDLEIKFDYRVAVIRSDSSAYLVRQGKRYKDRRITISITGMITKNSLKMQITRRWPVCETLCQFRWFVCSCCGRISLLYLYGKPRLLLLRAWNNCYWLYHNSWNP